ncbi:hypothetical protein K432DRAFT_384512 [Lepidopterella palustris CBS 459.81]|uniref:F-box domain-containing protein n=1 Tax=Lepidopterella palustris CBS 459.81 TaxID=1314670 RepID=A0A8E2JD49_9PEZI|nr:hypothetical protein K432DRAFT_384512 [Lepidopterella palustris CBS 459.81]
MDSTTTDRILPFRFFDLPSELRVKIYEIVLLLPSTIDLNPTNHRDIAPRLRLFLVSRRMHEEAFRVFYGSNTFRLFPVHGRFFHTKLPLLARLPPRYRAVITAIELRLGPGWTAPPKGWVVDSRLRLSDAGVLRVLKIFVECDPASDETFEGFRVGQDFYTFFCTDLVKNLFSQVSSLVEVQFDAYPSVKWDSPLMKALMNEVKAGNRRITWGPERGWSEAVDLSQALRVLSLGSPP